ncbi:GGDEF domain-containing protein, partial [Vibrio owensii]
YIDIDNYAKVIFKYSYLHIIAKIIILFLIGFVVSTTLVLYYNQRRENKNIINDSMLDDLTGCYNRKILSSGKLKSVVENASSCGVIVFDGNRIKMINDIYGHKFGDIAIYHIADTIMRSFRKEDFVVRTGGDEFLVIGPNLSCYTATVVAKEINANLRYIKIIDDVHVSVAFGFSDFNCYQELDRAIKKADKELYKNKTKSFE